MELYRLLSALRRTAVSNDLVATILSISLLMHSAANAPMSYWRLYENPQHAQECLAQFRERYNTRRPHWALVPTEGGDVLVPHEVYAEGRAIQIPRWQKWAHAAQQKLEEMLTAA